MQTKLNYTGKKFVLKLTFEVTNKDLEVAEEFQNQNECWPDIDAKNNR